MNRNLPPLHALPGFEAAARHLSFTRAAGELNLTQGAISRQVRELERHLGLQLFRRLTRRIELTEEGQDYFRTVQEVLESLSGTSRAFSPVAHEARLTISSLPSIASFWLMPRLHRYTEAYPNVQVRVVTTIDPVNLQNGEADIAIRVGALPGERYGRSRPSITIEMTQNWSDLEIERLFPDILVPVCSPKFLKSGQQISQPADMLNVPLIHTASRRRAWPDWLRANGIEMQPLISASQAFGHFFMSLEAARAGRGVAIIPDILFQNYDRENELLIPLPHRVESAGSYYLLSQASRRRDSTLQSLREWIIQEARHDISGLIG